MKSSISTILVVLLALSLSACGLADLRTSAQKEGNLPSDSEEIGAELLERAIKAQGVDKMSNFQNYEVVAVDHWKGLFGTLGKVWPTKKAKLRLRYAIDSFDSQLEFLDGKERGMIAGLQSWNYYEKYEDGEIHFKEKADKKNRFGLAAFHYFFELPVRLSKAEIVKYVGERAKDGKTYDLVFASWMSEEPNKEADQYVAWINKETGLLEYSEFTIRDSYAAGPASIYGAMYYADFREINGVLIPFQQSAFKNSAGSDKEDFLHRLTVESFEFDAFDHALLYPGSDIGKSGDAKE